MCLPLFYCATCHVFFCLSLSRDFSDVRLLVFAWPQVGCRRRPAILCLPTKNSPLNDDDEADELPRGSGRRRPPKCPPSPAPHEKPLRVLPGGWAEFYCSDAGGVGRIYYFHGITGQRSWKPPRVKKIGRDGGQSDKSDSEVMREFYAQLLLSFSKVA